LAGLVNLFVVAVEVQLLQDSDTGELSTRAMWLMAAINSAVTVVAVVGGAHLLGQRRLERASPVPSPLANMNAEAD
jgi:hypothetical protein